MKPNLWLEDQTQINQLKQLAATGTLDSKDDPKEAIKVLAAALLAMTTTQTSGTRTFMR